MGLCRYYSIALLPLSISVSIALLACSSLPEREEILQRRDVAIFHIPEDEYPPGEVGRELTGVEPFPPLKREQILALLSNLRYRDQGIWWDLERYIFYEEELRYLPGFLAEGLTKLPTGHRLEVISRYDPDKSVLGRAEYTSFLLWKDGDGINLVFGDIQEPLLQDDLLFEQTGWYEVEPADMRRDSPHLEVSLPQGFRRKVVLGNVHHNWLLFSAEMLASLPKERPSPSDASQPPPKEMAPEEASSGSSGAPSSLIKETLPDRQAGRQADPQVDSQSAQESPEKGEADSAPPPPSKREAEAGPPSEETPPSEATPPSEETPPSEATPPSEETPPSEAAPPSGQ